MVNLRADTRESIAKLTLMDDIFMNKVFEMIRSVQRCYCELS